MPRSCSTSASPVRAPARRSRARDRCSARRRTSRPRSPVGAPPRSARTCTRWVACCTRCSPAVRPSPASTPPPCSTSTRACARRRRASSTRVCPRCSRRSRCGCSRSGRAAAPEPPPPRTRSSGRRAARAQRRGRAPAGSDEVPHRRCKRRGSTRGPPARAAPAGDVRSPSRSRRSSRVPRSRARWSRATAIRAAPRRARLQPAGAMWLRRPAAGSCLQAREAPTPMHPRLPSPRSCSSSPRCKLPRRRPRRVCRRSPPAATARGTITERATTTGKSTTATAARRLSAARPRAAASPPSRLRRALLSLLLRRLRRAAVA